MSTGHPEFARIEISGAPSPDQIAAIVTALQASWPQPVPPPTFKQPSTQWRHADRWWSQGRLPSRWGDRQL